MIYPSLKKLTVLKNLSQNILDMPHYQSEIYRVRINYRRNLQNWLMPQLADEELQGYNYQQDGAPPHWHKEVRLYLNAHLLGRWVGDVADTDNTFCTWPPRSPDLTVCVISSCGVSSNTMFTSHHFQRHYQNCESASTP